MATHVVGVLADNVKRKRTKTDSEMKEEKKTKALFILTMPNVGSWNGKWTGEGRFYARTCTAFFRGKALYPNLKEGNFHYSWDDGWGASVKVTFVTPTEARKADKNSKGFCGYEWMIDSLKKHGKIIIED